MWNRIKIIDLKEEAAEKLGDLRVLESVFGPQSIYFDITLNLLNL